MIIPCRANRIDSQESRTEARLDNSLGLADDFFRAAFFKIDRTIRPRRDRAWREDRCSPSLAYRRDFDPVSLVVNHGHRLHVRTAAMNDDTAPGADRSVAPQPIIVAIAFREGFPRRGEAATAQRQGP
jgi:hypothetical protein